MTKICDIPYPIYDLTKNSRPYLWPVSVVRYNASVSIELQFLLNQSQCISANFQICSLLVVFKMNLNYREKIYECKICFVSMKSFLFLPCSCFSCGRLPFNPLLEGLFNNYSTEQSLSRPLVFNQSSMNPQYFPLNLSKFVSAMVYQPTCNQQDRWHEIEVSDQIPRPQWVVIKCPTTGKTKMIKFPPPRAGKGVKCPGYAQGGGMLKHQFDWYITYNNTWWMIRFIRSLVTRHLIRRRSPGNKYISNLFSLVLDWFLSNWA